MGSGSTIVASYINNRKYIGIDLEEEYINTTNKRLKDINMLNLYGNQIRKGFIYTEEGLLQTNKLKS